MKAWRSLLGVSAFAMGVVAACAQTPAPVLGNIETPYAALQATVHIAGGVYGPGIVAYGAAGTPLVLTGSNLGGSGTVLFVPYKSGAIDTDPGVYPVQANVTMWSSNMLILTVPSGAMSGKVTVTTDEAQTSNGLPFMVTPGTYAGTCPAGPTGTQLQITTASLHDGTVSQAYSATLGATGGTAPYTWSITSGTLPSALSLGSSTGAISGTPSAASSPTDITFQVKDSSSPPQTNDAVLSLQVDGATLTGATIYSYSASYDPVGNMSGYSDDPTGVPGVMGTWTFTYDPLNRLATANATWPDTTQEYSCWNYDNFGNRQQQEQSNESFVSLSGGTTACTAQSGATLDTDLASYNGNNQITSTNARGVTVTPTYDSSGDLSYDGANSYLYDADGHICAVSSTVLGTPTNTGYLYDGAGNRVAKGTITAMSCDPATSGFQMTESYVLGPSGEELSQFSIAAGVATWQRTNVYTAGKLLATYDTTGLHFHITDPVGTRRLQVGGNLGGAYYVPSIGQPETAIQSLPYGDQLATFVPDTYSPASADDSTPLHFTGKERDAETENDYFGARYYASSMARFMSPDWSATAEPVPYAMMDNPQSLNLFAYAGNNPLVRVDADGHDPEPWQHPFDDVNCLKGEFDACSSDADRPEIEGLAAQAAQQELGAPDSKPGDPIYPGVKQQVTVSGGGCNLDIFVCRMLLDFYLRSLEFKILKAPINGQQKSPARQQCEAQALQTASGTVAGIKAGFWSDLAWGAGLGAASVPVTGCVAGAAATSGGGPALMAEGCVVGGAQATNPGTLALGALQGASVAVTTDIGRALLAVSKASLEMAACSSIP